MINDIKAVLSDKAKDQVAREALFKELVLVMKEFSTSEVYSGYAELKTPNGSLKLEIFRGSLELKGVLREEHLPVLRVSQSTKFNEFRKQFKERMIQLLVLEYE